MTALYSGDRPNAGFSSFTEFTKEQAKAIDKGRALATPIPGILNHFEIRGTATDCAVVYNQSIWGGRFTDQYTAIGAVLGTYMRRGGTSSTKDITDLVSYHIDWTPAKLGNKLDIWLDVDSLSSLSNGDEITSWSSNSASNFSIDMVVNASRTNASPLYKTSGPTSRPMVHFDELTNHLYALNIGLGIGTSEFEYYAVTQAPVTTTNGTVAALNGNFLRMGLWANDDEVFARDGSIVNFGTIAGNAADLATTQIIGYKRGPTALGSSVGYLLSGLADGNDGLVATGVGTKGVSDIDTYSDLILGDSSTGATSSFGTIGYIGDVIVCNDALTNPERFALYDYLETKFNLTAQKAYQP